MVDSHEGEGQPVPVVGIGEEALNEAEDTEDIPGIGITRFCRNYPKSNQKTEPGENSLQNENEQFE